ncbi:MAG TPA: LuxR C-terminal-related transcriptional regulator [Actinopolymorphaceae bacterium]|jgi:DNA-binding CsgD family transcriptional regulator
MGGRSGTGVLDIGDLDQHMRAVYHLVLQRRADTSAQLVEQLGLAPAVVARVIERLVDLGLLTTLPDAPEQLIPLDPHRRLGPTIARRQARLVAEQVQLTRLQLAFSELVAAYASYDGRAKSRARDGLAQRTTSLRRQVEDLLDTATTTVVCFLTEAVRAIALAVSTTAVEKAIERGVSLRVVYSQGVLDDRAIHDHVAWLVASGVSARCAPSVPPAMLVVDRNVALVPAASPLSTAFVVNNRALTVALAALFDHVWDGSFALHPDLSGKASRRPTVPRAASWSPTRDERDVLRLLSKGMTDEEVAQQLGVSVRTVRRMMSNLMSRLHARSRFEAGVRAAEHGWLSSA